MEFDQSLNDIRRAVPLLIQKSYSDAPVWLALGLIGRLTVNMKLGFSLSAKK
jgi:hypothetical protein